MKIIVPHLGLSSLVTNTQWATQTKEMAMVTFH